MHIDFYLFIVMHIEVHEVSDTLKHNESYGGVDEPDIIYKIKRKKKLEFPKMAER